MDKMTLPRTPEDVLMGIFYFLPSGDKKIDRDREMMNRFFYEQRQRFSVLKDLSFRTRESFPESEALDLAYQNLVGSGVIGSLPHHYYLPDDVKRKFAKSSARLFNALELEELSLLSHEFRHEFRIEFL